jgi:hypothetical protein
MWPATGSDRDTGPAITLLPACPSSGSFSRKRIWSCQLVKDALRNANGTGIHNINCFFLGQRSSDAESHDVIAVVGWIAFSGGRSQQLRRKHPRAAAINSEAIAMVVLCLRVARRSLVRAPVGGNAGVAVVVTVLGPLPNVPWHVVKAECVRRLAPTGCVWPWSQKRPLMSWQPELALNQAWTGAAVSTSPQ